MTTEQAHESAEQQTRRDEEGGYVLAMTALLFIPMLIFAAFAVDVGAWYQQANRTQRAADAAALAAVVWMPDEAAATTAALDVAALNGFVHDWKENTCTGAATDPADCAVENLEGTKITVERTDAQQVRVTIEQEGNVYFGNIVAGLGIRIERFATAEFVLPVPMGNPSSVLGDSSEGLMLSMLAGGENRVSGDAIAAISRSGDAAEGAGPNGLFDDNGYLFVVDVPAPTAGITWDLQIRSTCFFRNTALAHFNLYPPDDTSFNDFDNLEAPPLNMSGATLGDGSTAFGFNASKGNWGTYTLQRDATRCNGFLGDDGNADGFGRTDPAHTQFQNVDRAEWITLGRVSATPGRWIFQMQEATCPVAGCASGQVRSMYSLRVVDGAGNPCSRAGASADPDCPNISARNWLGAHTEWPMFSNNSGSTGGSETTLSLAQITEEHRNKTLEVVLFDPADGVRDVKILMPGGATFADFTWAQINDLGDVITGPYSQYCTDSAADADTNNESCVAGNPASGPTLSGGRGWFQDKIVRIRIPIASDYTCGGDCWWSVVYRNVDGTRETTTWKARIIGDPVRLVE